MKKLCILEIERLLICNGKSLKNFKEELTKTFLWQTFSYKLHAKRKIMLNVASSGITSLPLPGCKTVHSQFSILLNLNEDSCCGVKQCSLKVELLHHTYLIIWDEAPMVNRFAFEDTARHYEVLVLKSDFRQILPVIPNGNKAKIVNAIINSSKLWKYHKVLRLFENMHLNGYTNAIHDKECKDFSEWLLSIDDGPINDIINTIYFGLDINWHDDDYFQERAILEPTLDVVNSLNAHLLSLLPGDTKVYLSSDSIIKIVEDIAHTARMLRTEVVKKEQNNKNIIVVQGNLRPLHPHCSRFFLHYLITTTQHTTAKLLGKFTIASPNLHSDIQTDWLTIEFLNDIKCFRLPDHQVILKKGVLVMFVRNLDISLGLCNGTRLIVNELEIKSILIPRMNLEPSYSIMNIKFQRHQFPVVVCFTMIINKSRGLTLCHVGVYLPRPVFFFMDNYMLYYQE
ncbi:hypothetical protein JHK85_004596 [Glycine max]|uniref:ATP-dependent DNA helicase n=1 Tax=Glycine max TaxID=3847 RepID=A0A0R0KYC2_SOYBN|nr:hypothetical protein JHK85_004596 [Glycine max]